MGTPSLFINVDGLAANLWFLRNGSELRSYILRLFVSFFFFDEYVVFCFCFLCDGRNKNVARFNLRKGYLLLGWFKARISAFQKRNNHEYFFISYIRYIYFYVEVIA